MWEHTTERGKNDLKVECSGKKCRVSKSVESLSSLII
jgi:hypothetical protein